MAVLEKIKSFFSGKKEEVYYTEGGTPYVIDSNGARLYGKRRPPKERGSADDVLPGLRDGELSLKVGICGVYTAISAFLIDVGTMTISADPLMRVGYAGAIAAAYAAGVVLSGGNAKSAALAGAVAFGGGLVLSEFTNMGVYGAIGAASLVPLAYGATHLR